MATGQPLSEVFKHAVSTSRDQLYRARPARKLDARRSLIALI